MARYAVTKFGFGEFMEQVCAFAAGLGVKLSEVPGRFAE